MNEETITKICWIILITICVYGGIGVFMEEKLLTNDNDTYESSLIKLLLWPIVLPIYIYRWSISFVKLIIKGFKDILKENKL